MAKTDDKPKGRRLPTKAEIEADKKRKRAKKVNAAKGVTLAPEGTDLRRDQEKYAQEKQGTNANEINRSKRLKDIQNRTNMNNSATDRIGKMYK